MRLDTDVRALVRTKGETYPTKRTMNLYFRVDRTTAPATAFLYILFALTVLLGLSKALLYDPWAGAAALEERALALEAQTAAQMEQLQRYGAVREAYIRSAPTKREQAQADALAVLDLIDRVVRPAAEISRVSLADNQALLTFSGVTLGEAAALVQQLEQSSLVASAAVDTASTGGYGQNRVEVNVYLTLAGGEEESGT